jgi:hypothetical protein
VKHHKKRVENRLVDATLSRLKQGKYNDGRGLWFIVKGGSRSWTLRYKIDGRERYMGLGSYPAVSLSRVRDLALEARSDIAAGSDAIEARDRRAADKRAQEALEAARRKTFRQCAEEYIAASGAGIDLSFEQCDYASRIELPATTLQSMELDSPI